MGFQTISVAAVGASIAILGLAGCGPRGSPTAPAPGPLTHTGSVGGYKFEMRGGPEARTEQVADPKGAGSYPKVTCGPNWFSIRNKRLVVNGRDYGNVAKPGDTIKVDADGKVSVNGRQVPPRPRVEPVPLPDQGPQGVG